MTAEELADEEWGPVKDKKKGKKAKGKKSKAQDDDDADEEPAPGACKDASNCPHRLIASAEPVDLDAKKPQEMTAEDMDDDNMSWGKPRSARR